MPGVDLEGSLRSLLEAHRGLPNRLAGRTEPGQFK